MRKKNAKPTPTPKKKIVSSPARSNVMEVGYPFFMQDAHQKQYSQYLNKYLSQERMFQGTKAIRWTPAINPNPSLLYTDSTDLGLIAINTVAGASYYGHQNVLMPLDDLFPNYQHQFLDVGWRKGVVGKNLFSVPQHVSIRLLFYRKDLLYKYFFKPPQTWDELEKQASTILSGEKNPVLNGFVFNFNPDVSFSMFLDYIWAQGVDLYENRPQWILNRQALETGLNQIKRFFTAGITPKAVLNYQYSDSFKSFLEGRSVFLHHWSDGLRLISDLPKEQQENFGWCLLPTQNIKVQSKSLIGGVNYAIPKNTNYPEAARTILKKIMEDDFQCWFAENLAAPFPGLKSVYLNRTVRQTRPYLDQAEFLLRHGKLLEECAYLHGDYLNWRSIGGQELSFLIEGNDSIQEVADRMEKRFAFLLPNPTYSGLAAQTIDYIQNHIEEPLKVTAIAQHLKVSPEHLIRLFKQQTQQTPLEYINETKMERAKILLKKSHLSIGEIAYRLGYKSRHHFSRLFHELVKNTPSKYRG